MHISARQFGRVGVWILSAMFAAFLWESGDVLRGLVLLAQAPNPCTTPANAIVAENCLAGNPATEWDVSGAGDANLQGFATDISVNRGQTISFKVSTTYTAYKLDIYRMGYYGGLGARKVASLPRVVPTQQQPPCLTDATVGLVDCGNWAISTSWAVPSASTSGIYFARVIRDEAGQAATASHIFFVVRDDTGHSDLLFQTSDTTWQAYNRYGGNSLYVGSPAGRAYKVSYNRPFTTRQYASVTFIFDTEYPMVRFLESNGYSVSYFSGVDTDRSGAELLEHKVFLSVGHDEYWAGTQRANVTAARDAGVHLSFLSGNEVFWKIRWENSAAPGAAPYRTIVCYKETHANAKIDPSQEWTGTWRDPRFSPPADGGRPENGLTGTIFMVNGGSVGSYAALQVPPAEGLRRLWRNTTVRTQALAGTTATLPTVLGYEWDVDAGNAVRPAGLFHLSSTTVNVGSLLVDYGSTYGGGTATHNLSMYRANSGALVFGAGTVRWAWGLDASHDGNPDPDPLGNPFPASVDMQQATVNLFADMGVAAGNLSTPLIAAAASGDHLAPSSSVTSPANGSTLLAGTDITIGGVASDSNGVVSGVEVSVDGGTTWHPATGTTAWTYVWLAAPAGTPVVQSRAVDDSANLETPVGGLALTISSTTPMVDLAFQSSPSGLQLTVGGTQGVTPFTRRVAVGSSNAVTAPSPQALGASTYQFASWSDAGAQTHAVVAPAVPQTYSATFTLIVPPPPGSTLGLTTVGGHLDGGDSNYLNGSVVTTPGVPVQVNSMSVYVGNVDAAVANRQYQLGIYADSAGRPGTLVAASAAGTLVGNTWNTLGLNASLAANSNYWLIFNTNGTSDAVNDMYFDIGASGQGVFSNPQATFSAGLPAAFPSSTPSIARYSIYVTLGPPDTTAPTATLTSPGSPLSGTVTLNATASDAGGVARVEFYADATLIGTDTTSPYSVSFDTTIVGNGAHALTAKAFDVSGNVGASAPVNVTTNNSVATPVLTPAGGTFAGLVPVSVGTATAGATIRYTTNGTDPTATSTLYGGAFTLTSTTTVKARAFKTGLADSAVATGAFTVTIATTVGMTTIGAGVDGGDSNYLNGSLVTTTNAGTVASMSVYVGAIDSSTTNRQFQVAIYTNSGSAPGTLVVKSASGTLVANSWNTIAISAALTANTKYWFIFNTNGRTDPVNDMHYADAAAGQSVYSNGVVAFGTWPATFPASTLTPARYSIYATFQ
jgi:Bacterial Ig domain/Chitobiase/beta-hexosaminidase C-terminal domain